MEEKVSKTSVSSDTEIAPKASSDSATENPKPEDAKNDTVSLERYKELEAFATRARQNEIAFATKAARAEPKTLLEISDPKVQAAAVKEIYGLDTIAQVQEVFGKDFWKNSGKSEDSSEEGEVESLKKEMKLFKVKAESERVENAIKALKASNPSLIASEKDEDTLRKEMTLISTELSPEERVSKAARLAFGDLEANKAKAIVASNAQSTVGPSSASGEKQITREEEVKARASAIGSFLFQGRTFTTSK